MTVCCVTLSLSLRDIPLPQVGEGPRERVTNSKTKSSRFFYTTVASAINPLPQTLLPHPEFGISAGKSQPPHIGSVALHRRILFEKCRKIFGGGRRNIKHVAAVDLFGFREHRDVGRRFSLLQKIGHRHREIFVNFACHQVGHPYLNPIPAQ